VRAMSLVVRIDYFSPRSFRWERKVPYVPRTNRNKDPITPLLPGTIPPVPGPWHRRPAAAL
jgi:hypothetical protein